MVFENTEVMNFKGAIRGMRNPLNSWDRSDSTFYDDKTVLGENDLSLMRRLIKAGSEHRKFMRQIFVSTDVIMPMYVAAEWDTYKCGTTRNSCSFQHKGVSKPFEITDFQCPSKEDEVYLAPVIDSLNILRDAYLKTKNYDYFLSIRRLLPSSYLYRFTWTGSYENIYNMYHQRKNHKLDDWSINFVKWVKSLPYAKELILNDDSED